VTPATKAPDIIIHHEKHRLAKIGSLRALCSGVS
jgi:hypothetical protein